MLIDQNIINRLLNGGGGHLPATALQLEVEKTMGIWHLEYFEAGATTAYMSETFFGVGAKDEAVARFFRLGGDDALRVSASKQGRLLGWLTEKVASDSFGYQRRF
jgi:hypothetical protein